jgi:hypothetical protein
VFFVFGVGSAALGCEISDLLSEVDGVGVDVSCLDFSCCGKFVLMSSLRLGVDLVVSLYYTGQVVERLFGVVKEDWGCCLWVCILSVVFVGLCFLFFFVWLCIVVLRLCLVVS